jgi:predicted SnoaL-like aldol condensation-catalyzing enzyme
MKKTILILALITGLVSCKNNKEKSKTVNTIPEKVIVKKELSNKQKTIALLKSFQTGENAPLGYINTEKHKEHNLALAGFKEFEAMLQNPPEGGFKSNVIRAFQDGEYVFTHTDYEIYGNKIGFDIFKFENGLIIEHWDNLIDKAGKNPSGHTQIDGVTTAKDLNKTAKNKTLVKNFISTILMKGEIDKLAIFFDGDNYIQHNPTIADGLSGLGKALEGMTKQGIKMEYNTIHKILGDGDFVLAVSEGEFAGKHTSYYDLFRVENGKIAEHWDVMETVTPKADRKNTNGKFNF